ncbi:MAG: twin-arginine translocase TatA/TatE family subunit [Acidimicrobiales bacterium]|nr:twin-arginine translocase TatA/TatE family subunit [Acidimicrobiales bacterium]
MLSLSPAKLLVILVIALVVLGPEKLPQVARQLGAAWHDLRQWRSRMESEVRGAFPNLPPAHEVAQVVRSPLAFLDRLADEHERAMSEEETDIDEPPVAPDGEVIGPAPPGGAVPGPASEAGIAPAGGNGSAAHNGSVGANGSGAGVPSPPGGRAEGSDADALVHRGFPALPDDPNMN